MSYLLHSWVVSQPYLPVDQQATLLLLYYSKLLGVLFGVVTAVRRSGSHPGFYSEVLMIGALLRGPQRGDVCRVAYYFSHTVGPSNALLHHGESLEAYVLVSPL